jgi:hypothetical protein
MSHVIEIKHGHHEIVGRIDFGTNHSYLSASRTPAGFELTIPAKLSFYLVARDKPIPVVNNLHGTISAVVAGGGSVEVGRLQDDTWHKGGWSEKPGQSYPHDLHLKWRGASAELALFEKLREGRPPQLRVELWGELYYLLPSEHPNFQVRTHPELVYGSATFGYQKELWVEKLRSIGALENILVEIPLPSSPPAPWDEVWAALVEARNAFEQGGATGWKGCVTAVRVALERWRAIEQEDMGPGWRNAPGRAEDRTKEQRLDNLRWHLHHCTHYWVHSPAEKCSRDDALLMLSTLSALLAERKP